MTFPFEAAPAPDGMTTALYRYYDDRQRPVYYGITDDLVLRESAHSRDSLWPQFAASRTVEWFPSRVEAEIAEVAAIATDRPIFNVVHNGADAETRAVRYLAESNRLDLLRVNRPARAQQSKVAPGGHVAAPVGAQRSAPSLVPEYLQEVPWVDCARRIRSVDAINVPLLVADPDTTQWLIRGRSGWAGLNANDAQIDEAVSAIMRRQSAILRHPNKLVDVLIGEPALYRCRGGGPGSQASHLLALAGLPGVRIGILPMDREIPVSLPNGPHYVFNEVCATTVCGRESIDTSGRSAALTMAQMDLLWQIAAEGDEMRELMARVDGRMSEIPSRQFSQR